MQRYHKTIFSSLHTLYRLSTSSHNLKIFLTGICKLYKATFKADRVVFVYKNPQTHQFMKVKLDDSKCHIKKGGLSILTDREKELLNQEQEITLDNRLIYPLVFHDNLGGVYVKRSNKQGNFIDIEKRLFLALSEKVTVSLKVFHMQEEERRMIVNYVKSLTGFLNQYVPTSSLHTKAAFKLIRILAKEIKLSESEIASLEYAALLHDAGKVAVPTNLLEKQKPLTDEEFKLVMKHHRLGVKYIKDMKLLKPAIPIILHHHEWYNGKGYPSRLKKEQIPIGARILAVIDAFDAMYYGRPYRERRPLEEVEKEFKSQAGKQFDPKVVEKFLKILRRKSVIKFLHHPH